MATARAALALVARLGLISYGVYLWHATIAIWFISHNIQTWLPVLIGDVVVTIAVAAAATELRSSSKATRYCASRTDGAPRWHARAGPGAAPAGDAALAFALYLARVRRSSSAGRRLRIWGRR